MGVIRQGHGVHTPYSRYTRVDVLAHHWRSETGVVCTKLLREEEVLERLANSHDPESQPFQPTNFELPATILQEYPSFVGPWDHSAQFEDLDGEGYGEIVLD
jgi:hypothetical protein